MDHPSVYFSNFSLTAIPIFAGVGVIDSSNLHETSLQTGQDHATVEDQSSTISPVKSSKSS